MRHLKGLFPLSQLLIFTHTNCYQLSDCTSNLPVIYVLFNKKMYYTQTLVREVYVFIVVHIRNTFLF